MEKKIRTWSDNVKVGIWDDRWNITLYEDKAILHMPYVKWVNNSGSLTTRTTRFDKDSKICSTLKKIASEEIEDGEDYTEEVRREIWDY